jgi:O-antigen/teichoic acid export membrane protein
VSTTAGLGGGWCCGGESDGIAHRRACAQGEDSAFATGQFHITGDVHSRLTKGCIERYLYASWPCPRRTVSVPPEDAEVAHRSLTTAVLDAMRQHGDVLNNASSLLATTGVTSAMGFAYWAIAARIFSQRAVGYGSATVSAITLLGTIGMFGLGTVLIGELPRRTRRGGLVTAALLASGLGSLVLGLGFAAVSPSLSSRFAQITGTPLRALLVAFSVALMAVGFVFDQATIGLLRGGVQLYRNLVFSLAKLLILPTTAVVLHDQFGAGIVVSWAAGMILSLAAAAIQLRRTGAAVLCRPDWGVLRGLGRTTLAHNWLNLAIAVPYSLMPVLVTVIVSPSANAAFYAAWMLSSFVYIIPQHLSTVLFAVASGDPQAIARKLRFTLGISVLVGLPGSVALALGAHLALSLFGAGYARVATFPLVLLAAGYLPAIPKVHYIAVCRATGKVNRAATVLTTFAVIEVAAAALGGVLHGLVGLSVALLVVGIVEGIATTPAVVKAAIARGRHRRAVVASASDAPIATRARATWVAGDLEARHPMSRSPVQGPTSSRGHATWPYAPAVNNDEALYRSKKAQQEAGLAVLLSLATTIGPDHSIPGIPAGLPPPTIRYRPK